MYLSSPSLSITFHSFNCEECGNVAHSGTLLTSFWFACFFSLFSESPAKQEDVLLLQHAYIATSFIWFMLNLIMSLFLPISLLPFLLNAFKFIVWLSAMYCHCKVLGSFSFKYRHLPHLKFPPSPQNFRCTSVSFFCS